ncbi:MAG TPA: class I SAM-dependent methyltransferase [bacterium]|nr:class I SAM-dependent methyltransferase [bacterium]HQQ00113.1 class I SAM-dependent methyltransferase [bacterium]
MRKPAIPLAVLCALVFCLIANADILKVPNPEKFKKESTDKPRDPGPSRLGPVYAPLAEWLVARYGLADRTGIGVDIGGGSGSLVVELCKRSPKMHWIDLDINPSVFPDFFEKVQEAGIGGQVSAIFSDVQWMALRDNYVDIAVSRGSYPFWDDKKAGFAEIWRILKPGGVAYIGRGFSENLPVEVAREIRDSQIKRQAESENKGEGKGENKGNKIGKGFPNYSIEEAREELQTIMRDLAIETYTIIHPCPEGSEGINYGIWIEIRKSE